MRRAVRKSARKSNVGFVLLLAFLALPSCDRAGPDETVEPDTPEASSPELTIFNPQKFEVTSTIQVNGTEVLESKKLPPQGKWIVPGPGKTGLWIAFHRTSDNQFLASAVLSEGTTFAQILLDTEIALIFKQNPQEKLVLANGMAQRVIVEYELQREIAISTNTLEPTGQPGSSVIAEQQPIQGVDLWIRFSQEDKTPLSTFVANDQIAKVSIQGKEHYVVGTPY